MIEKTPGITDVEAGTLCRSSDSVMPGFLFWMKKRQTKIGLSAQFLRNLIT